jgi:hypothetical protein
VVKDYEIVVMGLLMKVRVLVVVVPVYWIMCVILEIVIEKSEVAPAVIFALTYKCS